MSFQDIKLMNWSTVVSSLSTQTRSKNVELFKHLKQEAGEKGIQLKAEVQDNFETRIDDLDNPDIISRLKAVIPPIRAWVERFLLNQPKLKEEDEDVFDGEACYKLFKRIERKNVINHKFIGSQKLGDLLNNKLPLKKGTSSILARNAVMALLMSEANAQAASSSDDLGADSDSTESVVELVVKKSKQANGKAKSTSTTSSSGKLGTHWTAEEMLDLLWITIDPVTGKPRPKAEIKFGSEFADYMEGKYKPEERRTRKAYIQQRDKYIAGQFYVFNNLGRPGYLSSYGPAPKVKQPPAEVNQEWGSDEDPYGDEDTIQPKPQTTQSNNPPVVRNSYPLASMVAAVKINDSGEDETTNETDNEEEEDNIPIVNFIAKESEAEDESEEEEDKSMDVEQTKPVVVEPKTDTLAVIAADILVSMSPKKQQGEEILPSETKAQVETTKEDEGEEEAIATDPDEEEEADVVVTPQATPKKQPAKKRGRKSKRKH